MTGITTFDPSTLLHTHKGAVDIIDVPELGYAMVDGAGAPEGPTFAEALQALFAVSYGAHFYLKRRSGVDTKVLPLEALWWSVDDAERDKWRWRAMIVQPEPIDETTIAAVVDELKKKKELPGLARLRYERWMEGRCAQVLHIGPYAEEGPSIARLHEAMGAAGYRPHGRHHEIHLGDPRRAAPHKLRTLLRQRIESRTPDAH